MKLPILLTFVLHSILAISSHAEEGGYDMNIIDAKITAIRDGRFHLVETAIDEESLLQSEKFLSLQTKCVADWQHVVEHFSEIAGGDESKKLVIYGFGQLSAQDYMTVIESMVTKYENGEVSGDIIGAALFPLGRMQAFVRDNFSYPRVIAAIGRVKAKSTDASFKARLDKILDGTSKAMLDDFRDAHEGMPEGDIPKIILSN